MNVLWQLTKRNLLLFFRDKAQVFFSFLSVIIIIGLYVLFLSDLQIQGIKEEVGHAEGLAALVNSWVMAGLIAVSTVTIALGALGRIVADKQNKSINDFLVSPIKRNTVFLSYILSALLITMLLSTMTFIIAEIYIISTGGALLSFISILKVLGIIFLCALSSSLLMLFVVSFLSSEQTLGVISTIVGTLIGFVTGAYIPMGMMPQGIQLFSNIIPVSQGASLLRQIFVSDVAKDVFAKAPEATLINYRKMQGIDIYANNHLLTPEFMICFIVGSILLFGLLNVIRFKKMKS